MKHLGVTIIFCCILCIINVFPLLGKNHFKSSIGMVTYDQYLPLATKPIHIFYYIPPKIDLKNAPILIVIPGLDRNAGHYRDAWIAMAKKYNVMVFSLNFPTSEYSMEEYNEGGIMYDNKLRPEAEWTFSIIEPLFDWIRHNIDGKQKQYDIWGHSAGAQFVERFLLFKNPNRVRRAVIASAGWYTMPYKDWEYPYGLKNTSLEKDDKLGSFFRRKIILAIGMADTLDNAHLNRLPLTNREGTNRFERALYFWNRCKEVADDYGVNLNWIKVQVPNVGHDYHKIISPTAIYLYDKGWGDQ